MPNAFELMMQSAKKTPDTSRNNSKFELYNAMINFLINSYNILKLLTLLLRFVQLKFVQSLSSPHCSQISNNDNEA